MIEYTDHHDNTAATSSNLTADGHNYLKRLSGQQPKNFLSDVVIPASDEREMSLYVDLLTGEDGSSGHPTDQTSLRITTSEANSNLIFKDKTNHEDENEICSQFLVGTDLVKILDDEKASLTVKEPLEEKKVVSDFIAAPSSLDFE